MQEFSINLTSEKLNALKLIYEKFLVETNEVSELVFFRAIHNETHITAYTSGKVLFEGNNITDEVKQITEGFNIDIQEAIFTSSYGSNDIFGPICVCSVAITKDKIDFIEKLNVLGKHSLSTIIKLGPILAKNLTYSLDVIAPLRYNHLIKNGYSMNKILSFMYNSTIINTSGKINYKLPVVCDKFTEKINYFNYLKSEKFVYQDLIFEEDTYLKYLGAACSKIICQYEFLVNLEKYSKEHNIQLRFGRSNNVLDLFKEIYNEDNSNINLRLSKISKLNNKKVLNLIRKK